MALAVDVLLLAVDIPPLVVDVPLLAVDIPPLVVDVPLPAIDIPRLAIDIPPRAIHAPPELANADQKMKKSLITIVTRDFFVTERYLNGSLLV
ncbi:hypothetical protein GCM10009001_23120 [Virgibacillus siamensis]|uniref:Uncharacterized protein n=1 Tax=Virgibacillus siamensis TaxID=480071 RepID=A0ABP3RD63_9BACI